MARNENRRRKKLEARRKKQTERKRDANRQLSLGKANLIATAAEWPVVCSKVTDSDGIMTAVLARKSPSGTIGAGIFLVDCDCLGVKDAFAFFGSAADWKVMLDRLEAGPSLVEVTPEYICKLVRESVDYAHSIGFRPHRDFAKAAPILDSLDPSQCFTEFEFGQNGKPLYVAGPRDDQARQRQILATLERTVGAGNYNFVLPVAGMSGQGEFIEPIEETDDELSPQRLS